MEPARTLSRGLRWRSSMLALVLVLVLSLCFVGAGPPVLAQERESDDAVRALLLELQGELQALRAHVDTRLAQIESRLTALERGASDTEIDPELEKILAEAEAALGPSQAPAGVSQPGPPQTLNPQVSVIGDFLAAASRGAPEPLRQPSLDLREVEIAFQSRIDPFARADFYVTVPSLEDVEIEEAFVTFLSLPADFLVRLGKLRIPFGRANVDHRPESFTVDRPDVIHSYFGDEGLAEMGVSVARLVPNPWERFMEVELDVLQGANEVSFGGGTASDLLYNLRFTSFFDLSLHHNVNVGASYANGVHGLAGDERLRSELFGLDLTYNWRPLKRGSYRSFVWQTEWMNGRRSISAGNSKAKTWGLYSFARWQLSRRWYVGGRFDRSQDPDEPASWRRSLGGFVELFPSEFQRFRLQYKHSDFRTIESSHELFFQWYYLIGTHGAHRF